MPKKSSVHPVLVFWLGVLTGALIVGLIFLYKAYQPPLTEDALLRIQQILKGSTQQTTTTSQLGDGTWDVTTQLGDGTWDVTTP